MRKVEVALNPEQFERLRLYCGETGGTLSGVMRLALERFLGGREDVAPEPTPEPVSVPVDLDAIEPPPPVDAEAIWTGVEDFRASEAERRAPLTGGVSED